MSLELILGPMFSGKTSYLIQLIERFSYSTTPYIVVKHKIDTRFAPIESKILATHGSQTTELKNVIACNDFEEVYNYLHANNCNNYYVFIDETQFFNKPEFVPKMMMDMNIHFYCAGLSSNFNRKPWPTIIELEVDARKITKLSAICGVCKDSSKDAIYSHLLTSKPIDGSSIVIGGSDKYIAVCLDCWKILHQ